MIKKYFILATQKITAFLHTSSKINAYLKRTPVSKRKIILGGHWSDHKDWLILNEYEQDITKKLRFKSNSVDVIFMEHVFEHITFENALFFLKEAKRVLRKGGVIRIVSPFLDALEKARFDQKNRHDKLYINNGLSRITYPNYNSLLKQIGIKGEMWEDVHTFLINGALREHGHKFVWSTQLLKKVMERIGFKAAIYPVGKGRNKNNCIERKMRGVYLGTNWEKDAQYKTIYDPESMALEGINE